MEKFLGLKKLIWALVATSTVGVGAYTLGPDAGRKIREAKASLRQSASRGSSNGELEGLRQAAIDLIDTIPEPEDIEKLDLNQVDETELARVPGIDSKLAREIVQTRSRQGGFKSFEELNRVNGLQPAIAQKLGQSMQIGEPPTPVKVTTPVKVQRAPSAAGHKPSIKRVPTPTQRSLP